MFNYAHLHLSALFVHCPGCGYSVEFRLGPYFFYVMLCYASSFNLLSDHHYRVFQAPSGDINISSSLRCFLVAFILWVLVHCYRCVSAVIIVTSYCNTLTIIYAYTVFTTSPFLNNSLKKNQPILMILVNHILGKFGTENLQTCPVA